MLAIINKLSITGGNMSLSNQHKSYIVADYLIAKAGEAGVPITNKILQKLVYYCQAWFYVTNDKKILFPDTIEAWVHGPVVPNIFRKYTAYGWSPLTLDNVSTTNFEKLTKAEKDLIDEVYDVYGKLDAEYLEALTHREDPWTIARGSLLPYETSKNEITIESMGEYYGKKLEDARAAKA